MRRALLLVDGEHHPSVMTDALPYVSAEGYAPVAALFLGGFEKTGGPPDLGVPLFTGEPSRLIGELIGRFEVEVVLDWSDEPILDPARRFFLAGLALAAGATYRAGGMTLNPPPRPRLTERPTVAVIGTGKRTGKTAVAIELARWWKGAGLRPVIVTMGRGGPPDPIVLDPSEAADPFALFEKLRARGLHAASDYVEDVVFAGVPTVGTRRLGAGPGGVTVWDGFAAGVQRVEDLGPDLVIFEGSGTAIPPAHADATILVTRGNNRLDDVLGHLGTVRLALSRALVVVGPPAFDLEVLRESFPGLEVFCAELQPEPSVSVADRSVVVVTTAPSEGGEGIREVLREMGAARVQTIHCLSDRRALPRALDFLGPEHLVLTEVKAAAADVVIPLVHGVGADVGLIHNRVVIREGNVGRLARRVEEAWSGGQDITR